MSDCRTCKEQRQTVPYIVHEADMARQERTIKRLWILIIMFIALTAGCVAAIISLNKARVDAINELLELERSIETVYEYEVDQQADNSGSNYFVGGDFNG